MTALPFFYQRSIHTLSSSLSCSHHFHTHLEQNSHFLFVLIPTCSPLLQALTACTFAFPPKMFLCCLAVFQLVPSDSVPTYL